jgi:hypothetical protein
MGRGWREPSTGKNVRESSAVKTLSVHKREQMGVIKLR